MTVENENNGTAVVLRKNNDNNGGEVIASAENVKLVENEQNNYMQTVTAIS